MEGGTIIFCLLCYEIDFSLIYLCLLNDVHVGRTEINDSYI